MYLDKTPIPAQVPRNTFPETQARFPQHWEIISFATQDNKKWSAFSTDSIHGDPLPFETITVDDASSLVPEKNINYFVFNNREPVTSKTRFTDMMETGCRDHIRSISEALGISSKQIDDNQLIATPLANGKLISFIYKPSMNGWIAVETVIKNNIYEVNIYAHANKANREEEKMGKETLYFNSDSKKNISINPGLTALQSHFNIMFDEIDPHLGKSQTEFQPDRLKQYLGLPKF